MNRRDTLKGAGMAFSGLVLSTGDRERDKEVLAKLGGIEEVRVTVEPDSGGTDDEYHPHIVTVYDLRTGAELPWLVQRATIHLEPGDHPTVFLRFVKDEPVYGVRVSAYGFLMDYAFEGRVRA